MDGWLAGETIHVIQILTTLGTDYMDVDGWTDRWNNEQMDARRDGCLSYISMYTRASPCPSRSWLQVFLVVDCMYSCLALIQPYIYRFSCDKSQLFCRQLEHVPSLFFPLFWAEEVRVSNQQHTSRCFISKLNVSCMSDFRDNCMMILLTSSNLNCSFLLLWRTTLSLLLWQLQVSNLVELMEVLLRSCCGLLRFLCCVMFRPCCVV